MTTNPIFIIDDDSDDRELLVEVLEDLKVKNELFAFSSGKDFFELIHRTHTQPSLILCDIDMPAMDGITLFTKFMDNRDINALLVPFVFWAAAPSDQQVKTAYSLSAHGVFVKPRSYSEMKNVIAGILSNELILHTYN